MELRINDKILISVRLGNEIDQDTRTEYLTRHSSRSKLHSALVM